MSIFLVDENFLTNIVDNALLAVETDCTRERLKGKEMLSCRRTQTKQLSSKQRSMGE